MLVRELIEQLAEMPPDLPVMVDLPRGDEAEVVSSNKGGRLRSNTVWLHLDSDAVQEMIDDIEADVLENDD